MLLIYRYKILNYQVRITIKDNESFHIDEDKEPRSCNSVNDWRTKGRE